MALRDLFQFLGKCVDWMPKSKASLKCLEGHRGLQARVRRRLGLVKPFAGLKQQTDFVPRTHRDKRTAIRLHDPISILSVGFFANEIGHAGHSVSGTSA
jgi:hypothetical protein